MNVCDRLLSHAITKSIRPDTPSYLSTTLLKECICELSSSNQTHIYRNSASIAYILRYVSSYSYLQHHLHAIPPACFSKEVVMSFLQKLDAIAHVIHHPSILNTFLLFWDINAVDDKQLTLLNYAVAEKNEEMIFTLIEKGAFLDVENSCYNNAASICMFAKQTPSQKCKRIRDKLLSKSHILNMDQFLDVEDALCTENKKYCLDVLANYTGENGYFTFDCNTRNIANSSLLSFILHLEVLQTFLNNGFVITTKDVCKAVNYIPMECIIYIITHCDVQWEEVAEACKDDIRKYRVRDVGVKRRQQQRCILDQTLQTIPTDICHMIVSYL